MKVLIVYAHPEPKSFNGAMKDLAVKTLTKRGHTVEVSDLYAMKFNPAGGKGDFTELSDPAFFKFGIEQVEACRKGTFAPDVAAEMEKVLRADFVILQFPLWWFSLPAILKGWVDRVFASGFAYGAGKWYDRGPLRGRKAMLAVTTGGPRNFYAPSGINGDINQLLFPIEHGILYFSGMQVLPAFIAWSVARESGAERARCLEEYRERLMLIEECPTLPFPKLDDYDENMMLKTR
jgi:NAD(P)H dehydrogenase (quinone)